MLNYTLNLLRSARAERLQAKGHRRNTKHVGNAVKLVHIPEGRIAILPSKDRFLPYVKAFS